MSSMADEPTLRKLLTAGKDKESVARAYVQSHKTVPDGLITACLGNRMKQVPSCPKALKVLLDAGGNPNAADPTTQCQALHTAAWQDSVDVTKLLLDAQADINGNEPRMNTPPLNTAIAAGSAAVALELLNRNADVQWRHNDGATALHVATAWIASSHNAQMRLPPVGSQPRAVIAMMLHNGVDPTLVEGMSKQNFTPLRAFLREVERSPWRQDRRIVLQAVHLVLEQGEAAVLLKQKGNKAFSEQRYEDAIAAYNESMQIWETAGIRGHHTAVLWSNTAKCYAKLGSWIECGNACEEGLKHYSTSAIRDKLQVSLKEALENMAGDEDLTSMLDLNIAGAASDQTVSADDAEAAKALEQQQESEREAAREALKQVRAEKREKQKLAPGFLAAESAPELYPNGSEQGTEFEAPNRGPFICDFREAQERGFPQEEMRRKLEQDEKMRKVQEEEEEEKKKKEKESEKNEVCDDDE